MRGRDEGMRLRLQSRLVLACPAYHVCDSRARRGREPWLFESAHGSKDILPKTIMTKTEKILVAKQGFVARRGRTIESQVRDFLRAIRANRSEELKRWSVMNYNTGEIHVLTGTSIRHAKYVARRGAVMNGGSWGVVSTSLCICVWETWKWTSVCEA